jgi:large subunit ribosomal protein L25
MGTAFELEIDSRDDLGKAHSRRLRRQGKVPAVLYGGGKNPASVALDHNKLLHQMENEAFYTSILTLNMGKKAQAVVVKDVQHHPVKRQVLHVDFQRILADEKITLLVPIHYSNQEEAIGVKVQGGEIAILVSDVEVSCLPGDLPEFLEVSVLELELNQRISLSDIVVPKGVEILALSHDQDHSIIAINPPRKEEEDNIPELTEDVLDGAEADGTAEDKPAESDSEESKD